MARIEKIEIENFRGIRRLTWRPEPGVNCLVGPGDCGKTTVLQAVDWCLGARRQLPLSDADFHRANVNHPIRIVVTVGELYDQLLSMDAYGPYLRGLNRNSGDIEDEPGDGLHEVLSVELTVGDDLVPHWALVSERAAAEDSTRDLSWKDRQRLAPAWIGGFVAGSLAWRRGSVLTRISEEEADVSGALADAARAARLDFGAAEDTGFAGALSTVRQTARRLGIADAAKATAMLDPESVSPTEGAIALHDEQGVPLRRLGLGSARLLVAGLQGNAAAGAAVVLVDEVEQGLEPHRIARFLVALGSKDEEPQSQVFMTTHSPVVLRELAAHQIHVLRCDGEDRHLVLWAGDAEGGFQGPLRSSAEGFLGTNVLVCEGATEVGLVRGIDLYRADKGEQTLMARGGVLVDADGVGNICRLADSFRRLGYRTAVLRDDDKKPAAEDEARFKAGGGAVFHWRNGRALEDALFSGVSREGAVELCKLAARVHGEKTIHEHLRSARSGPVDLDQFLLNYKSDSAPMLAKAAKAGEWFKRISTMEEAAREIVGPALSNGSAAGELQSVLDGMFEWAMQDGD